MNCKRLRGSDVKGYIKKLEKEYGFSPFSKKDNVEECSLTIKGQNYHILKVNNVPFFFIFDRFIPTLNLMYFDERFVKLPKVIIDMGAVPYVINGSDIMRPGIVKYDNFEKDSFVLITDEKHGKLLAIGRTIFNSREFDSLKSGKVIKMLHYIGDGIWKQLIPIK